MHADNIDSDNQWCAETPGRAFRTNGFASFGEDRPGSELMRSFGLTENFLWANDFPHHKGTWPHSAAAIERRADRSRTGAGAWAPRRTDFQVRYSTALSRGREGTLSA